MNQGRSADELLGIRIEIVRTFQKRLFHWADREWQEEIDSGFSRLSRIESIEAEACVAFLRSLSAADLKKLTKALIKQPMGPPEVLGDLFGAITPEERALIERFQSVTWARMSGVWLVGPKGVWSTNRANRSLLRRLIREPLTEIAGAYEEFGGRWEWHYRKTIGRWQVYTHIDMSDRQQQIEYHHAIQLDTYHRLIESISLLRCLGLAPSIRWNTLAPGHEGPAVETLRELCEHFLGALPALLEGL